MALKKSELYSSLWSSCDELRGGMDASQYKDYVLVLLFIKYVKSKGKGACILPHGVLFRGNAEAEIRKNLIKKGYIKGIISLPANLFYGTGIPACILVLDKEYAASRKGIFMIDASKGFMKDGNKNRLRNMDIYKIVEVFNQQLEIEKYSKMISFAEIEKNEYNLNIPRYIDSQEAEDIQDIEAHILGGIPNVDIDALLDYWEVYPTLRTSLFAQSPRGKYSSLKVKKDEIKQTIFEHPEFIAYTEVMNTVFSAWRKKSTQLLKDLQIGLKPKKLITELSENLLACYTDKNLISKYDIYQHLMDYWTEFMQDDCYLISIDGWKAETYRILVENKQKKIVDKGWTCDLLPKELVTNRYFYEEKRAIEELEEEGETLTAQLAELEEEQGGDEGFFAELEKVNKEKELDEDSTAKEFSVVQKEGSREVTRKLTCYSLEAIIAVGYRVNSDRGTQFRQWAITILQQYIHKGFAIDSDRFKYGSRHVKKA